MDQILLRRAARIAAVATAAVFVGLAAAGVLAGGGVGSKIEFVPGEFVVELHQGFDENDGALSRRLGAQVVDRIRSNVVLVRADHPDAEDEHQAVFKKLRENEQVSRVEPNYIYRLSKLPNDPGLAETWGLKNVGSVDTEGRTGIVGIDVGAEAAWELTTGSKSVIVAVIDTGIDFKHPDLKDQAWFNEAEKNGTSGVDDDGNGLIDDVNGYNFANDKGDSTDDNGHGSHCAGTIGAKGDDGLGLVGVSWDVSLMAIKFLDKNGSGTLANALKSVDYARTMGAHIVSNSWGGGAASPLLKSAIEEVNKAGILFVVAAGNNSNDNDTIPTYPASYDVPNIISVAAIDNRGALAGFSNYGAKSVHVAAPGVNVVSTVTEGKYESLSGTSMAAPHVSGVAALLLAHDGTLTHHELRKKIIESARPIYGLKNRVASAGIADAFYAMSGQTPPADPNDPSLLKDSIPYVLSTDHPYKEGTKLEHKIHIPGAKKIAVRFSKFDTEASYDTLSFYDGKGDYVAGMSGAQGLNVISPLIQGDTVTLKFSADETVVGYGFDVEAVLFE